MISHNFKANNQLYGQDNISGQHIKNNKSIRQALLENDIILETLAIEEDTKKLKKRLERENKKAF